MNGLLLVDKAIGERSFGLVEDIKRSFPKPWPKVGHCGTLDPFASGLMLICVGQGVKLSEYFLKSEKTYTGSIRFGQTTIPGDPTDPISETSSHLPSSLQEIQNMASALCAQEYLQTPPMHSAKKIDGKPLYELARQGIEIERKAVACRISEFTIESYVAPVATFKVRVSSGTYIRTLAQDLGRLLGTVAMLDSLRRTDSGPFSIQNATPVRHVKESPQSFIDLDQMLSHLPTSHARHDEATSLLDGKQEVLPGLVLRAKTSEKNSIVAICFESKLIAVAKRAAATDPWKLDKVLVRNL